MTENDLFYFLEKIIIGLSFEKLEKLKFFTFKLYYNFNFTFLFLQFIVLYIY
jgi:hypothetical protein